MKKPIMKMLEESNQRIRTPRIIILAILLVLLTGGLKTMAQDTIITTRFANGYYDSINFRYYIDVELQSNLADIRVYGFNVRFFYESDRMQYLYIDSLLAVYEEVNPPAEIQAGNYPQFGLSGPQHWVNTKVQFNASDYRDPISVSGWTKMFTICFQVKDPEPCGKFCPSIVWDLELNAGELQGGYLPGDDGVVITVSTDEDFEATFPVKELAVHWRWVYFDPPGQYWGAPSGEICCPPIIPVANWPIYLAIGLMLVASVLIYRRRISG